jgi:molecular chaperone DnaK
MIGLGIDFGSAVSAAAVIREGEPVLIPSAERVEFGGKSFPTCVALTFDERILVGDPARAQIAENPEGTTCDIKRCLGKPGLVSLRARSFSPERLAGFVLEKIKRDAEAFLGVAIRRATIGVPVLFDARQHAAMRSAAEIAGFARIDLIEEPVAAALSLGLEQRSGKRILVVDLGVEGLNGAVVVLGDGAPQCASILSRPDLSATAFDELVFRHLAEKFAAVAGKAIDVDPAAKTRLRRAAEIARIELGSARTGEVEFSVLAKLGERAEQVALRLTRDDVDCAISPLLRKCGAAIEEAMRAAGRASQIDRLLLVGGTMRRPEVRTLVEQAVGRSAEAGVDPTAAIAVGAARDAADREDGGRDRPAAPRRPPAG